MGKSILSQLGIEEEIFDQCGGPGKVTGIPDWRAIFDDLVKRLAQYEGDGNQMKLWHDYWREDADDDGENAVYTIASVLSDYTGIHIVEIMAGYGVY